MAVLTHTPPMPGPTSWAFPGRLYRSYEFLADPLGYMRWAYQTYGPLSAIQHGDASTIFAFTPEYNRVVLSDSQRFYTVLEEITPARSKQLRRGVGLLNMNGEQHRQQRKLMMPAFHRKQVEGYRDDMVRFTQAMLDRWQPGQQLDLTAEIRELTMRIAVKTLFGLDLAVDQIGATLRDLLELDIFSPAVLFFPFDLPGTRYHRILALNDRYERAIMELIETKRRQPSDQRDVLGVLIHARDEDGSQMSDVELIGQTNTLFIAGHETSANVLTWTIFLLMQHPQVFADVLDEIEDVLGGAAPTTADLPSLIKLGHVLDEVMRLLPPATMTPRISTAPFTLGSYDLPKGTVVTIAPFMTHRLPDLWDAPNQFRPERWERIDPSPYEYLPFGAGPRMCIGATFALTEIKIVLAMLLQRFRPALIPGTDVDWKLRITLSPRAIPMIAMPQDRQFRKQPVRGNIHALVDLGNEA